MDGFFGVQAGQNRAYIQSLFDNLNRFGVPVEAIHTETGPGVYEAAIMVLW
jgi:glutamine synthetase